MRISKPTHELFRIKLSRPERFFAREYEIGRKRNIIRIQVSPDGISLFYRNRGKLESTGMYFSHPLQVPTMPATVAAEVLACVHALCDIPPSHSD